MMHPSRLNRVYFLLLVLAGFAILLSVLAGTSAAALAAIFLLAVLKARLIVLDFLEMRGRPTALRAALLAWQALFALAGLAKIALSGATAGG